jgi:hypothetical protein
MKARTSVGCAWTIVLMLGLGASAAEAFGVKPIPADAASLTIVTPAAMCGRSCQGGGRYIAGPPSVCEQYGLNYCGPSRGGPQPGVGVYVPGTGVGVGVGPGGAGVYVAPGSNCRTVTIERDDGSVRRIRRCD